MHGGWQSGCTAHARAFVMLGHSKRDNSFPSSALSPFASRSAITIMPLFSNYSTLCCLFIVMIPILKLKILYTTRMLSEHTLLVKECIESCQVVQIFLKNSDIHSNG